MSTSARVRQAPLGGAWGGDGREHVLSDGEEPTGELEVFLDERDMEPETLALSEDVAPGHERVAEELKAELSGRETRRADRV